MIFLSLRSKTHVVIVHWNLPDIYLDNLGYIICSVGVNIGLWSGSPPLLEVPKHSIQWTKVLLNIRKQLLGLRCRSLELLCVKLLLLRCHLVICAGAVVVVKAAALLALPAAARAAAFTLGAPANTHGTALEGFGCTRNRQNSVRDTRDSLGSGSDHRINPIPSTHD